MRRVLHGTRRKTNSVREASRAVRTFGVHLVRIASRRLAGQNPLFSGRQVTQPTKERVLVRKAHRCDVRGAGLWPTGVHERLWNAADEVPPLQTRVLMRKAHRAVVYWST